MVTQEQIFVQLRSNILLIRAVQDGSVDDTEWRRGQRVEDEAMTLFSNAEYALRECGVQQLPADAVEALRDPSIVRMLFERLHHEERDIELDLWAISQIERLDFEWKCCSMLGTSRDFELWECLREHMMYLHVLNVMRTFSMDVIAADPKMQTRLIAVEGWLARRDAYLRSHSRVFREAIASYSGWGVPAEFDREQEWWFCEVEPPRQN